MMDLVARKALDELLEDADGHHRMTDWEDGFLSSIRQRAALDGEALHLSDKQLATLKAIEAKVYAT